MQECKFLALFEGDKCCDRAEGLDCQLRIQVQIDAAILLQVVGASALAHAS